MTPLAEATLRRLEARFAVEEASRTKAFIPAHIWFEYDAALLALIAAARAEPYQPNLTECAS